jgi:hypothetical protein
MRATSPKGLGISGKDAVGVSGDSGDGGDPVDLFSVTGNTFVIAWGSGVTNSGLNRHRIEPGGRWGRKRR